MAEETELLASEDCRSGDEPPVLGEVPVDFESSHVIQTIEAVNHE